MNGIFVALSLRIAFGSPLAATNNLLQRSLQFGPGIRSRQAQANLRKDAEESRVVMKVVIHWVHRQIDHKRIMAINHVSH